MNFKVSHIALSERKVLLRLIDVLFIICGLWLSFEANIQDYIEFDNDSIYNWLITLIFYFFLFGEIFQLFNLSISNNRYKTVRSLFLTSFLVTFFFTFTPFLSPSLPENRLQIIYLFLLIILPVLIWRFIYICGLFSPKYFKDILIISHSSRIDQLLDLIKGDNFHNLNYYLSEEKSDNYKEKFKNVKDAKLYDLVKNNHVKEVIISTRGFSSDIISQLNKDIILLFEEGINIKSFESFYEEITDRVPKEYLDYHFYKNINLSRNSDNKFYKVFHRILDIIISIIGLMVFLFLIPIIFIMNILANRGPLFYTQNRVGEKGKIFKIYKLRSMIVNAESDGAVYAEKNDKRITLFGRFLRNTRLDEVPQFYNILKGEIGRGRVGKECQY